jgi:NADPH:quinone reductase-like Zn-dependent oxidoreductase
LIAVKASEEDCIYDAVLRLSACETRGSESSMKVFELASDYDVDYLKLVERPDPKLGPGQVLLQMRAWSLNYRDVLVVKGRYGTRPNLPVVPLSDGVGIVMAIGVSRVILGDRVAPIFMQRWIDGKPTKGAATNALGADF